MAEHHVRKLTSLLITLAIIVLAAMIYVLFPRQIDESVNDTEDQTVSQQALTSAPKFGATAPKALFIEFGDFQCPGCKTLSGVVDQLSEEYRDSVQFVWIHSINTREHPQSRTAAIAAQCASEQNRFKPFHDALFDNQDNLSPTLYTQIASQLNLDLAAFNACLVSEETAEIISNHQRFTQISRINETPTVAINDQFFSGDLTYDALKSALDEQLNN